jgi:ParB family chromosome partitioning protein
MTDDPKLQRIVAQKAVDEELSVRETERSVRRAAAGEDKVQTARKSVIMKDANVRAAETRLARHFSTNVKIKPTPNKPGGRIEIEYYGHDDLDRIYDLLIKK